MATFRNESFERIVQQTLKRTAAALRDNSIPFCLIGSLSAWVRGGPESSHDLDFGIKIADIIPASMALQDIGMQIEIPPEDWLIKAHDPHPDGSPATLVDLIYAPSGVHITDEVIERADYMDVLAHKMRVLNPTDLMVMKLLSLREQNLNLTSTIATARSIGEQRDWGELYEKVEHSPYALGFFEMAIGLGLCPEHLGGVQNEAMSKMQASDDLDVLEQRKELQQALQKKFI